MKKLPIVAIVGRANVGKSSLFNAVLDRREAIVAREAGTTRDSIMAKAEWEGQHFWLVDTAGIKEASDDFEFTIQEQIQQAADSADVIWVVIEADVLITEEDRRVAKMALKSKKPVFLVVNKLDKAPRATPEDYLRLGIKTVQLTSTTQHRGIAELLDELVTQIPQATLVEADDRLHVALLGRPNVGKSALFNTLAKKQQAIVADRAGTTRDVNRATVRYEGREIELMDTAGIRRSGKIERGIEQFSVIRSLAAIEEADICLLLLDANEPHVGQNVAKLFDLVLEIDRSRHTMIKTTELNRWLREIVDKHPPAGLKNRTPKLNYIVQESQEPTNFKVYGAHAKFLHWSYKRYMDRTLREKFGFSGTPVKFWFFDKHETHKHGRKPEKD
jgi:small GTP-binding protein